MAYSFSRKCSIAIVVLAGPGVAREGGNGEVNQICVAALLEGTHEMNFTRGWGQSINGAGS